LVFRIFDLLKIARQAQGRFYIRRLSTLVSSREQNDHFIPNLFVVHPVTRTVVDPQFGNSPAYRLDISGVALSEALDPNLDSRPRAEIAQSVEPVGEELRSCGSQAQDTVACWLHTVKSLKCHPTA
jgi:hypothetical protein